LAEQTERLRCKDCVHFKPIHTGEEYNQLNGTCECDFSIRFYKQTACRKNFKAKPVEKKKCLYCGKPSKGKFCSTACRKKYAAKGMTNDIYKPLTLAECVKIARAHGMSYGYAEANGLFRRGK
jgi:hypothetical protein